MTSAITAARRRHLLLASSFLAPLLSLGIASAQAQQTTSAEQSPPIEVSPPADQNRTRAKPTDDEGSGTRRAAPNATPSDKPNPAPGTGSSVSSSNVAPTGGGSGGRQFAGIVGTSSTVITAEDIAHSP